MKGQHTAGGVRTRFVMLVSMLRLNRCALLIGLAGLAAGCSLPSQQTGFRSDDPEQRTKALGAAARSDDRTRIPDLIAMLDSSDPAQRMLAIRSLERMTGQTLGYDHAAPEPQRAAAIDRWMKWEASRGG